MEPAEAQVRYKLILGKFRVGRVEKVGTCIRFNLEFPGLGNLIIDAAPDADVRDGDLLTLYTEILANAKSSEPPIQ